MAKKKRKKVPKKSTLFVLNWAIRYFEGDTLALNVQLSQDEWDLIVHDTVIYSSFLQALKEKGLELIGETWTTEEEAYLVEINRTIARMRNIDPLLVAKYNIEEAKGKFIESMHQEAEDINKIVWNVQEERRRAYLQQLAKRASSPDKPGQSIEISGM